MPLWIKSSTRCWRRQRYPTPVLLPGKSHGQGSLVGCSPWGRTESDTTERLHFHFSLSCIGEGNGNPLQRSCLEIPRDGGAWWAAVYGVAQSQTRLKRLSSLSWEVNEISWLGNVGLNEVDFFTTEPPGKATLSYYWLLILSKASWQVFVEDLLWLSITGATCR